MGYYHRHCPKCQSTAAKAWLAAREAELLPVRYFHLVFTLPKPIADIAFQNKREIYNLLMRASADTVIRIAAYSATNWMRQYGFSPCLSRCNSVPSGSGFCLLRFAAWHRTWFFHHRASVRWPRGRSRSLLAGCHHGSIASGSSCRLRPGLGRRHKALPGQLRNGTARG